MIVNYIKIALRNLSRQRGYSVINILGLAIGLTVCLIIVMYVADEMSYDRYHEKSDRIYRVTRQWFDYDGQPTLHLARIAAPIGPLLENDFALVEESVRFHEEDLLVSYEDRHYVEDDVFYTEPEVFKIFDWDLLAGNPETALTEPFTCVITQSTAEKYFGNENPVGQILIGENETDLQVTGVVENIPRNSHFRFNMLLSFATLEQFVPPEYMDRWNFNNYATYLLLTPNADPDALRSQFPEFLNTRFQTDAAEYHQLHLQPLPSIHLYSQLDSELGANGNITYIYIFSGIAFLVILIASFNFMNLATARATRRSKEVGVRKVLGSQRRQLMTQFLIESLLMTSMALIISFGLINALLPAFNNFTGKSLSLFSGNSILILVSGTGLVLLVGLVAGSYPAVALSSFQPVRILKGQREPRSLQSRFRTLLVVSQFAISATLLISMISVFHQVSYLQNKNLGFDTSQLVTLPLNDELVQDLDLVKNRLLQHPQIVNMTASKYVPSEPLLDNIDVRVNRDGEMQVSEIALNAAGYDFASTFQMELVAGRDFSQRFATDSAGTVMINESAVQQFGWDNPQEAIGEIITLQGSVNFVNDSRRIVGVIKDFHFETLRREISPVLFIMNPDAYNRATIRLSGNEIPQAMTVLENEWNRYFPNYPFEFEFLADEFDNLYRAEIQLGKLLGYFGGVAIFIAVLGLFGLATFAAENRRKEISVRKVVGANVLQIIMLLSRDFTQWVLIANLIAWPAGYFIMKNWLNSFAVQTELSPWIFLLTVAITLGLALLTVSYQSAKAALTNPATVLKYE